MRIINEGNAPKDIVDKIEAVVLHLDKFWEKKLHEEKGRAYYPPKVILFTRNVMTPCGEGRTDHGPFFCGRGIYIDVQWFERLVSEYGAEEGEFAQFYIVAHEFGHHIQSQIGTFSRALGPGGDGGLRVRAELEADGYAGFWARSASEDDDFPWEITEDDINNALAAAQAVGDDTIHLRKTGSISPERFGHGTAYQRQAAFMFGFNASDMHEFRKFYAWELEDFLGKPDHDAPEEDTHEELEQEQAHYLSDDDIDDFLPDDEL